MQVFVFIYLGKMLGSSQRIFCPPSRSKAKIKLEGLTNTLRMEYGPLNTPGSCTKQGLGLGYRLALGGFGTKGLGTGLDNNTCTMSIQMKVDVSKDDIRKAIVDLPMDKNYKISCQV